ncbi:MAG: polysaccharide biosynthesis protein [Deltaproteobacteria bacterium]|nr:polysaccharide biosynthesis protein [Deltaproteobacteria bacterium]
MKQKILYKNFVVIFCLDIIILFCSIYGAYLLRFDFNIPDSMLGMFFKILPVLLIIKITCFYFFDLYRGMWRYTSVEDLLNIIKACTVSSLLIITYLLFSNRFIGVPRSVFIIDFGFTVLLIAGLRLSVRFYFEHFTGDGFRVILSRFSKGLFKTGKIDITKLLIIGAGDGGEKIYREIHDNSKLLYNVVGFLDDNPVKLEKKIHGIPILGSIKHIGSVMKKSGADEALIAIPSAGAEEMRRIVEICKKSGIKFKTVPGMGELLTGQVSISAIREVSYQDLLSRDVIRLDKDKIGSYLTGGRVLITGAGGSIGSELCRQVCRFNPSSVMLYESAESPLYEIELELKKRFKSVTVVPVLADIRDKTQLTHVFKQYKPQTVFHAAAYKHVPMMELHPWKAIENNIAGTLNLVEVAKKFKIKQFVFVSTDKAVRPANVMGASKRVSEMIVQSRNKDDDCKTRFISVRFGNVLGSVGSVVPLFKKQIKEGGPVTVTDPEVTRYFMTIPEACQLILQAGAMGKGGEMYIFDMGQPVKIADMAEDLIRLSGLEPGRDIKIEYTGLRPGEKLFEELITEGEKTLPSCHEKILVLIGADKNQILLNSHVNELILLAGSYDAAVIKAKLKEIVLDYKPCLSP